MQAKRQTIQVSKYPSIQGQNLTQELCLTVMMQCVVQTPMSRLLRAPYVDSPRVPLRCLPGYLPRVDRAAACMIRVWAVFRIICPWVMSGSVTIWVPYMRRVIGSFRVVLSCILLLLFITNISTPWDPTPGYPLGGLLG